MTLFSKKIQGLVSAYKRIVPTLTFGGPSRLSPVIRTAIETVKKTPLSQENQIYHVLLIVTVSICLASKIRIRKCKDYGLQLKCRQNYLNVFIVFMYLV